MKLCTRCGLEQPLESFSKESGSKDGRQTWCKDCFKDRYRSTADRHRRLVASRKRQIKTDRHEYFRRFFDENPCLDCGEGDIRVLEFDHVRGDKVGEIFVMVNSMAPWSTILEEMTKCEVVCANCHKKRTYSRCNSWRVP